MIFFLHLFNITHVIESEKKKTKYIKLQNLTDKAKLANKNF